MATHDSIIVGEFHGQRSLAGYSPWGLKESDTTEHAPRKQMHSHIGRCRKRNLIQHPFMIKKNKKTLKSGTDSILLSLIDGINDKPIANIILSDQRTKGFPLKTRQPLSTLLFIIALEVPAKVIRQKEKGKSPFIFKRKTLSFICIKHDLTYRKLWNPHILRNF